MELADAIEKCNLPMDQPAVLNDKMNKLLLVVGCEFDRVRPNWNYQYSRTKYPSACKTLSKRKAKPPKNVLGMSLFSAFHIAHPYSPQSHS
jgi:hypothetical protein